MASKYAGSRLSSLCVRQNTPHTARVLHAIGCEDSVQVGNEPIRREGSLCSPCSIPDGHCFHFPVVQLCEFDKYKNPVTFFRQNWLTRITYRILKE